MDIIVYNRNKSTNNQLILTYVLSFNVRPIYIVYTMYTIQCHTPTHTLYTNDTCNYM